MTPQWEFRKTGPAILNTQVPVDTSHTSKLRGITNRDALRDLSDQAEK